MENILVVDDDPAIRGVLDICLSDGYNIFETDNVVLALNDWTHVVLVQDGVSPVLYIDGVLVPITFSVSTDTSYGLSMYGMQILQQWMSTLLDTSKMV